MADYPRLSFEQGDYNSFYFSEEILSTEYAKKDIHVGNNITAVPLRVDDAIEVGWISHKDIQLTRQAAIYLEELKAVVAEYGVDVEKEL